jgi:NTP pyrophosphatase (non-canonical NTP hydrolase)
MNPKEYEQNVLVTESTDLDPIKGRIDSRMVRLLHAGLGLSSELAELADAASGTKGVGLDWPNIAEEAGDLLWYVAVAVNSLGFDHDEVSSGESGVSSLGVVHVRSRDSLTDVLGSAVWAVGEYNDQLKKHLFYGRELNLEKVKKALQQICMSVSGICFVSGTTTSDVRNTNIAKLRARYGDKFTEAAALNRNLEVERKILEEGI